MRGIDFPEPQGLGAERLRGLAVNHQFEVNMKIRKVDQVGFVEHRSEFLGQIFCVLSADSERYDCPDISEDRGSDFIIQLQIGRASCRERV